MLKGTEASSLQLKIGSGINRLKIKHSKTKKLYKIKQTIKQGKVAGKTV